MLDLARERAEVRTPLERRVRVRLEPRKHVGHHAVGDVHAQRDLVAARGVHLVGLPDRGEVKVHEARAVAGARVVHDDLLIHLLKAAHAGTPKNSRTEASASTNLAASSSVVYTCALARVEPARLEHPAPHDRHRELCCHDYKRANLEHRRLPRPRPGSRLFGVVPIVQTPDVDLALHRRMAFGVDGTAELDDEPAAHTLREGRFHRRRIDQGQQRRLGEAGFEQALEEPDRAAVIEYLLSWRVIPSEVVPVDGDPRTDPFNQRLMALWQAAQPNP